jgi:hypothetical protein
MTFVGKKKKNKQRTQVLSCSALVPPQALGIPTMSQAKLVPSKELAPWSTE